MQLAATETIITDNTVLQSKTYDLSLVHPIDARVLGRRFDRNSNPQALLIRFNEILKPHGAVIKGPGSIEFVNNFANFILTLASMRAEGAYQPNGDVCHGAVANDRYNTVRKSLCGLHFNKMRSSRIWRDVSDHILLPDFLAELE